MNYHRIYQQLCIRGQERQRSASEHYERHHVVPKSVDGTNDASNLTWLTVREHFLAHWLLTKMYVGEPKVKMVHAFRMMCVKQPRGRRCTSHLFKYARQSWLTLVKNKEFRKVVAEKSSGNTNVRGTKWWFNGETGQYTRKIECPGEGWIRKGRPSTDKQRKIVSELSRGRVVSESTRQKISAKAKRRPSNNKGTIWIINNEGVRKRSAPDKIPDGFVPVDQAQNKPPVHTDESRWKISQSLEGRRVSEETRIKISKTLRKTRYGKEKDKTD